MIYTEKKVFGMIYMVYDNYTVKWLRALFLILVILYNLFVMLVIIYNL